jgi:ribose-phosphate pyrophosphokinase
MHRLNLAKPEASDIKFEKIKFSDGQPHIKLTRVPFKETDGVIITSRLNSMDDLFYILEATQVMRAKGFPRISLNIPYLIGARMDRFMTENEPFTLKIIANIINSQNYERVWILDPHSDVSGALIDNVIIESNVGFATEMIARDRTGLRERHDALLVSPDAGAYKKISKLAEGLPSLAGIVMASKVRDLKTGEIKATEVYQSVVGADCYIVDDICDGGRTFTELAKVLRQDGATRIVLIVTHGVFSKGLSPLFDSGIDAVYTTNSISDIAYDGAKGYFHQKNVL